MWKGVEYTVSFVFRHHSLRCRAVSDLVEELLSSPRYNSRTRPASDRGLCSHTLCIIWENCNHIHRKFQNFTFPGSCTCQMCHFYASPNVVTVSHLLHWKIFKVCFVPIFYIWRINFILLLLLLFIVTMFQLPQQYIHCICFRSTVVVFCCISCYGWNKFHCYMAPISNSKLIRRQFFEGSCVVR